MLKLSRCTILTSWYTWLFPQWYKIYFGQIILILISFEVIPSFKPTNYSIIIINPSHNLWWPQKMFETDLVKWFINSVCQVWPLLIIPLTIYIIICNKHWLLYLFVISLFIIVISYLSVEILFQTMFVSCVFNYCFQ